MTVPGVPADQPSCPVCGAGGRPLLYLPAQPIYQHPVSADAVVPEPHAIDLVGLPARAVVMPGSLNSITHCWNVSIAATTTRRHLMASPCSSAMIFSRRSKGSA